MKQLYKDILNEITTIEPQKVRARNDRVLLIDGLNTFIRSWTVTPTMNDNGDHVGGITGTLKSIGYAIRETNPTRVVVVFDGKKNSSRRKKKYSDYKANRKDTRFRVNRQYPEMMNEEEEKESMRRQILWLTDILDYLPVTTLIYDGIEADDVIAYISRQILTNGEQSVIMSSDRDFLQLVNDTTLVWSPTKKKLYNREEVYNEYGIWPKNLLLYRALSGDKSDNIPGIDGVGLKTLLKRWPEMGGDDEVTSEQIIERADKSRKKNGDYKYKVFETVNESKDQLKMNIELMQLEDPDIGADNSLKIMDRFREPVTKFNRFNFMKIALKYKILQNWPGVDDWLRRSFGGLMHE